MTQERSFGDAVAHSLGLRRAPRLVTRSLRRSQIAMFRHSLGPEHVGMTPRIPAEDTFVTAVYLTPLARHELFSRGRRKISQGYTANALRIVNLEDEYSAHITAPHEALTFYLPRAALDALGAEDGLPRLADLRCDPGILDPVVAGLVAAILPAFTIPAQVPGLFLDHVAQALSAHLGHRYGDWAGAPPGQRSGLSKIQLRRAMEILSNRLEEDISVEDLARECGLSRGHFARGFRLATGLPPHRWLLRQRVERAKDLLLRTHLPAAEIAARCGFADQSHLTRVFGRHVGAGPAAWRRAMAE